MMNAARIRYRLLRLRAHAWLGRHPRLRAALHAAGTHRSETIARGVAIGLFIGLTPTIGLQTALTVVVCILLSGNFPVAFASSFVANPFTVGPLYWGYHELGEWVMPVVAGSAAIDPQGVGDDLLYTGLGSLMVALPVAVAGYLLTRLLLSRRA